MTKNPAKTPLIPAVLIAVPVVFWLFVIYKYAANVPWFDDFDPFPDFLRHWILSDNITEKFKLIFQPNNEHRMIWGKLTALFYYKLTGTLDFRLIQIFASFLTLSVLFLFWKAFKAAKIPLIYFVPIPFFIFHLQFYGTYLWAICSMQHQPVVFFTAVTCWLVAKGRFNAGLLTAICANFAMGNGILVWTSGVAILIFLGHTRQLIVWILTAVAGVFLYFVGMSPQGNETSFSFFAENPHLSFIGFFTFLGGLFDLSPDRDINLRMIPTFAAGLVVGVYVIWWVLRTVFTKPPISKKDAETQTANGFLIGILVFILANAAVIALLRPRFGMDVMLVSNYKIYPGIFLAAAYLSLLMFGKRPAAIWKAGLLVAAGLWLGTLFIYFPTVRERKYNFEINAYNQKYNQFGLGFEPGSKAASYIDELVQFISQRDIYHLPETITPLVEQTRKTPAEINFPYDIASEGETVQISVPDLKTATFDAPLRFFNFSSDEKNYLFKADPNINRGRNPFKKFEKGINLTVSKQLLEKGTYEIKLYDGQTNQHYLLDQVVIE